MKNLLRHFGKKNKYSPLLLLQIAACGIFCLWIVMGSFPTGWIYDIGVSEGTAQGEWPDSSVSQLTGQEALESYFLQQTPTTVNGSHLIQCPLMRLRDVNWAGEHHTRVKRVKRTVYVSEYLTLSNPVSWWQNILRVFATGGSYNRYFLMELADSSYVCVYFDDYILWRNMFSEGSIFPTGYLRQSTADERSMLESMEGKYHVNASYVLDLYRHGKMSESIDLILRAVLAFIGTCAICLVWDQVKKRIIT